MAGKPTEAEVQAMWRNAVAVLENDRAHADSTYATAGGVLDVLQQSLEGEYAPEGVSRALGAHRAAVAGLISRDRALSLLVPIIQEYSNLLQISGGYRSIDNIMAGLYERFHTNGIYVQSRNITYDGAPLYGFNNRGFGILSRLILDQSGYPLEYCHAERKEFRCRRDKNSGARKYAEVWSVVGSREGRDSLLRGETGSGELSRSTLVSRNAGTGDGGSLLANSSFQRFVTADSGVTFPGWTQTNGDAVQLQRTTENYRIVDRTTTDGSLQLDAGATVTLQQPTTAWVNQNVDPNTPYFYRVMVNADELSAVGGTVTIRLGSTERSVLVSSLVPGWNEVTLIPNETLWFRKFNVDDLAVEIEWEGSVSGSLLVDDCILAPWTLIDGTYWMLRGSNDPWLVDDTISVTDTGGAPEDGKLQWWLFVSGLGYLPSSDVPNFEDPA